jgi:hypothetical protein
MRWCSFFILVCALLLAFGCSTVSQMAVDESVDFANELKTIVILGSSEGTLPSNIIEQILGNVTTVFMNLNYQIVERRRLDSIIHELSLSYEDFFDEETAQKIGMMVGSDGIVMLSGIDAEYEVLTDKRGNVKKDLIVRRATLQMLKLDTATVALSLNYNDPVGMPVVDFIKFVKKKIRAGTGHR